MPHSRGLLVLCSFAVNLFHTNITEIQISKSNVVLLGAFFSTAFPHQRLLPSHLWECKYEYVQCQPSLKMLSLMLDWVTLAEVK